MSFLIDPPLLFLNGEAYGRLAPEEAQQGAAKALGAATVALFWTVSIALYLNRRWPQRLAAAFGSRDGRDFMVNSGLLRIDTRRAGTGMHAAAALIFATYPLWLLAGWRHGRRSRA